MGFVIFFIRWRIRNGIVSWSAKSSLAWVDMIGLLLLGPLYGEAHYLSIKIHRSEAGPTPF
jgi:hypothetical protein